MSALTLGLGMLLVLAMALCWLAFRSARAAGDDLVRHRTAQREFYRQRQSELQADLDMGLIDRAQFTELNAELDKQLLDENAEFHARAAPRRGVWLWVSLAVLPLLSWSIYDQLGYRLDLKLLEAQQQLYSGSAPGDDELQRFEGLVEAILARRPETAELLVTMATIRRQQGDYAGAVDYYQRLQTLYPEDADVLAQLAQSRYLAANRQLDERSRGLLQRALAINPQQTTALGVLGIHAFASGDYLQALSYWQRLQGSLDARSNEALVIASGINEAKRLAVEAGLLSAVGVEVALAPELGEVTGGVLFVVARADDGNPMPVAALRLPLPAGAENFPLRVYLGDSDVIRPDKTLDDFANLSLSAHISRAGTAAARPGDWRSTAQKVNLGQRAATVNLLIDRLVPDSAAGGR